MNKRNLSESDLNTLLGKRISHTLKSDYIRDILRDAIKAGHLLPGEKLPPLTQIASHHGVSVHTIREAVTSLEQMGYLSSIHGSGTYVREQLELKRIAVIIPNPITSSASTDIKLNILFELLRGFDKGARDHLASVVLFIDDGTESAELRCLQAINDGQIDAVILFPANPDAWTKSHLFNKSPNIPVIVLDRRINGINHDYIGSNNYEATKIMINILLKKQIQNIIFLTDRIGLSSECERITSYENSMNEEGMQCLISSPSEFIDDNRIYKILQNKKEPCAVFASNAVELEALYLMVPDIITSHTMLTFASFDESAIFGRLKIPYYAIRQPFEKMGIESIRFAVENPDSSSPISLALQSEILNLV